MEFLATEVGFSDGMAGASNQSSAEPYHYVLFGKQIDDQNPENSGIYFEYDDQLNGTVNQVVRVDISVKLVRFHFVEKCITVLNENLSEWENFLSGIEEVFSRDKIQKIQQDA